MLPETITRQQLIDNAHKAIENLINLLPETIPYHPDTQMRVEQFPYAENVHRMVFTAEIVIVIPTQEAAHDD